MLGWFNRPATCPIPEASRDWVERRADWIVGKFGREWVLQCPVILPTQEFFPEPYDERPEDAQVVFDRVCHYLRIPPGRVELYIVEGRVERATNNLIFSDAPSAMGTITPLRMCKRRPSVSRKTCCRIRGRWWRRWLTSYATSIFLGTRESRPRKRITRP